MQEGKCVNFLTSFIFSETAKYPEGRVDKSGRACYNNMN